MGMRYDIPTARELSLEKLYKALANRRRRKIIRYLKKHEEKPVSDIAGAIGLSIKSTSNHLLILSNADLVSGKKDGLYVLYRFRCSRAAGRIGEKRVSANTRQNMPLRPRMADSEIAAHHLQLPC